MTTIQFKDTERTVASPLNRDKSTSTGRAYGGGAFTRGQIYRILNNPIYIGCIPHRDQTYDRIHEPIIASDLWDAVQTKLADNINGVRTQSLPKHPSPLVGKLFDAGGELLVAAHTTKKVFVTAFMSAGACNMAVTLDAMPTSAYQPKRSKALSRAN